MDGIARVCTVTIRDRSFTHAALDGSRPKDQPVSTTEARRAPKFPVTVPIILGIFLVPLSQIALVYLGRYWGPTLIWIGGTPLAYFLIGGLSAFSAVRGLPPAQASSKGALVGLITGISGACSLGLVVVAIAVWSIVTPPQPASLLLPQTSVMSRLPYTAMVGPPLPPIVGIIILLPYFVGVNLLGFGVAPLGGMHGGYLRARFRRRGVIPSGQEGEQGRTQTSRGIVVVSIVAALMTILMVFACRFFIRLSGIGW